jgi:hypothetical protein
MSCRRCGSNVRKGYNTEIAIHCPGTEGLNKPAVWVFPTMMICHSCGFVEFELPQQQLSQLKLDSCATPRGNGQPA